MTATPNQFFHGVQINEQPTLNQPLGLNDQAAVGLVGTAPMADLTVFPYDTPVLLSSNPALAESLTSVTTGPLASQGPGTLPQAVADIYTGSRGTGANIIVVNVAPSTTLDTQLNSLIGSPAAKTGMNALLGAQALLGVKPKTLIVPGYTAQMPSNAANPVVDALIPIATALRGRIYASTPSDSYEDALAWTSNFSSDRIVAFYPNVLTWSTLAAQYANAPAESVMAGLLAWVQNTLGFWWSPSNKVIDIGGVSTPIDWSDSDPTSLANLLNQNKIATIIKKTGTGIGGWYRWGNTNLSTDTAWQFEAVRTTADAVYEGLGVATQQWVDADPTPQTFVDMTYDINNYIRSLVNQGILIGGRFWLDPIQNTPTQMAAGIYVWDFDGTPGAPMQTITINTALNDNYYQDLLNELSSIITTTASVAALNANSIQV